MSERTTTLRGRLVLADRVLPGVISVEDGLIAAVEADDGAAAGLWSRRASSTSTFTAGAATRRWAAAPPWRAWPGPSSAAA